MSMNKSFLIFPVLMLLTCALAQDQGQDQTKPAVKHVPMTETSPASGKAMFNSYCAVCHGTDGKGGGPAASALKTPPSDLTQLSKSNGGKYPSLKVASVIRGTSELSAHGSKDMPVWGPLFWGISKGHESEVQQRVANLTEYIETLQKERD
jgi:mono/diheme cytochrome c family protein